MDLSRVILGPIVTEKAERLKATERTYTLHVAPQATKVDVKKALRSFYDVDVARVRVLRTRPKSRLLGSGAVMEKRHAMKKVMVTLSTSSKNLDLGTLASH